VPVIDGAAFQSSCATAANRQQVGSHSFRLTLLQNSGQTFPQSFRNGIRHRLARFSR